MILLYFQVLKHPYFCILFIFMSFLWPQSGERFVRSCFEKYHISKVCLLNDFLISCLQCLKEAPYRCHLTLQP